MNKNPFPKSHKYEELIKIYSDIAINGSYKKDGTFVPPSQLFGMSGQVKFKDILKKLFTKYNIKTLLDYGAGQGSWENKVGNNQSLKNYLNLDVVNYYEPARQLDKKIISDCNLKIKKGEVVCILGNSGSGKSTLMDILMGLIKPAAGNLYIDGIKINSKNIISWQKKIAHVPQEILLLDDTIKRNIAFGVPDNEINNEKITHALQISLLDKVINNFKDGLNTKVGERGSLLSGGQRQRIGIARAIYQSKEILFLDEATSALDIKTEGEILKNLTQNKTNSITVILITHKPRYEIKLDKVIEIDNNNIKVKQIDNRNA
mgnify:CR=1 FL=1